VSRYKKGKTNPDFTEARDSKWQWHQLGHMQVDCTSLQTDNHASTPPLKFFLQAGCPSCCPANSIKALKALSIIHHSLRKRAVIHASRLITAMTLAARLRITKAGAELCAVVVVATLLLCPVVVVVTLLLCAVVVVVVSLL